MTIKYSKISFTSVISLLFTVLFFISNSQDVPMLFSGSRTVYSILSPGPQHGVPVFFSQTASYSSIQYESTAAITGVYNYNPTSGIQFGVECVQLVSKLYCVATIGTSMQWTSFSFNYFVSLRQDLRCGSFSKIFISNGITNVAQPLPKPWNSNQNNQALIIFLPFISGINTLDTNFAAKLENNLFNLNLQIVSLSVNIQNFNASKLLMSFSYLLIELNNVYGVETDLDLDVFQQDLDQFDAISQVNFVSSSENIVKDDNKKLQNLVATQKMQNTYNSPIIFTIPINQPVQSRTVSIRQIKTANSNQVPLPVGVQNSKIVYPQFQCQGQLKKVIINGIETYVFVSSQSNARQTQKNSLDPQEITRFRTWYKVTGLVFKLNQVDSQLKMFNNFYCQPQNIIASFQLIDSSLSLQNKIKDNKKQKIALGQIKQLKKKCLYCYPGYIVSKIDKKCVKIGKNQSLSIKIYNYYPIVQNNTIGVYIPR